MAGYSGFFNVPSVVHERAKVDETLGSGGFAFYRRANREGGMGLGNGLNGKGIALRPS